MVQLTLIGPARHFRPPLSATGFVPTNESWLSRATVGRPTDPRKTKPGSPTPVAFGAGTGWALQSTWIGGVLGGWIAIPHVTFPPSAVHSSAPDVEPSAGAGARDATIPSAQTGIRSHKRCTRRSSHAGGRLVAGARGSDGRPSRSLPLLHGLQKRALAALAPASGEKEASPRVLIALSLSMLRLLGAGPKPLVTDDTSCYTRVCLEMPARSPFRRSLPRLALSKQEAAESLGVSPDFFDEWVAPELRMVRKGRRRLIPIRELERWLEKHADLAGSVA